jgi:uncharacterized repeat protein (TIGR01451 family)
VNEVMKPQRLLYSEAILVMIVTVLPFVPLVSAGSYDGHDLAVAMLTNPSVLVSSSYWDRDTVGHRMSVVLSSRGAMLPTDGSTFALFTTGRGDLSVATSNGLNPGNERGDWFQGGQYGTPRDEANLQMQLQVPVYMHYLYYDVQFFTVEYPDYVGTQYNDKLTITVNSPSKGVSSYLIDVNGGDFVLHAGDSPLIGTGFDLFAQSGDPSGVDWLQTTPVSHGADAGASALVGREHPVSPGEVVTVTIDLIDAGDNQFNSGAFIDNMHFSGYAKAQMLARKTVVDLNGGLVQCGDIIEYDVSISNIGTATQNNNPDHEFADALPAHTQYVAGSATASSGTVAFDSGSVAWDGSIASQSSVMLSFKVMIDNGLVNGTKISNQGVVQWDENEDGVNEKNELTDDPTVNDYVDQDGDGETGDDDPTILSVWSYEPPTTLVETFADIEDVPGGRALDSYQGVVWYETSQYAGTGNFEVAPSYFFETARSFKMKLRASAGLQYWNYSLGDLNSELLSWSSWFACGNSSDPANLLLQFKTASGGTITQVKFEYVYVPGAVMSSSYQVKLSVMSAAGWTQLTTQFANGYLYNGWYNLKVEKSGETNLKYTLTLADGSIACQETLGRVGSPLSDLTRVVFSSSLEPVVCPLVFWDEHTLSLQPLT